MSTAAVHPNVQVLPQVETFLARKHGHFVGGQTVPGTDQLLNVYDPATGRIVASVPNGTDTDGDRAAAA
jgi:phenylacetaldehyde dehydrogenase